MLLVDGSGSMSGDPYNTASMAAKEVMLALQGNPDYKVTVWNYTNSGNELDVVAGWTDGKNFHWPNMRGGGTPSHQAMVKAHEFLKLNYKHSPKIIVHFTDLGWGDSPTEEFDALANDNTLDYITVTVAQVNGRNVDTWLASVKDSSPGMNVSAYTTNELVQAVQEFILKR